LTNELPPEPELGLEVDDSGELGLLMPGEPGDDPPPRLGAAGPPGAPVVPGEGSWPTDVGGVETF
jgi:hypothetical protein